MTLPSTYADRNCSLARSLEVVGERWTLLIIRDAFYGVRRFGDFAAQLRIPRAVLAARLKSLVQEDVLTRDDDGAGSVEYRLTAKGIALWPALHALMNWGDCVLLSGRGEAHSAPRPGWRPARPGGTLPGLRPDRPGRGYPDRTGTRIRAARLR